MFDDIKIIFLDIDNTLTTRKKRFTVSVENKLAIKEMQRKKIYIVLATGRSRKDVERIWNMIHLNEYSKYVIYANGAMVENILETKKIIENPIDEETYNKLIDYALEKKYFFSFSENETMWTDRTPSFIEKVVTKFLKVKIRRYDKNFEIKYSRNKFGLFVSFSKKRTLSTLEKIKEQFPNLEIVTSTKNKYIEITNKNVSKAEGAKKILEKLNLSTKEALALGDSMNDYELFKFVGTSVIVKNGSKQLKKVATYKTKSAKKNGVAKILRAI